MDANRNRTVSSIDSTQLKTWCINKLAQAGVSESDATTVADVLVHANLRGVDSHGVLRMEHYVNKINSGGIRKDARFDVRSTGLSSAVVDADDGFGHVASKLAMDEAIRIAATTGIGAVSVINSSHCGALSYFVQMAAKAGFIGIAMTNTDKQVTPFGGSAAYFGTNPMAYGFPAGDRDPVILDMATSSVAYGKILEAIHLGSPIPANWAVDDTGRPITDPGNYAALLPFGGPKGYGLGMIVDIFAGLLTGSPFGPYVTPMYGSDPGVQRKLGHFMLAIDIGRFTRPETFTQNMHRMMDDLHAMPPAPGFDGVKLPGEIEAVRERERLRDGIPLTEDLIAYLRGE